MGRTRHSGGAIRRAQGEQVDTLVLARVSWVVLALGLLAAALFALEPDVRLHPGLALLSVTGLVGTGMLRLLAHLLRTPPGSSDRDDEAA